ncbi:MAG: energy transducer TonB [Chitinophagaceae bacterium]|nr:energy transducer TonB [Chitinophagaceae bacterium]
MKSTQPISTDWLDILFQHRNQLYGAYELRRNYPRRLRVALCWMLALCGVFIALSSLAGRHEKGPDQLPGVEFTLDPYLDPPPPPPPPPPVDPISHVRQEIFVQPLIVPDHQVSPEEEIPPVDVLSVAAIGTVRVEGDEPTGIVEPTTGTSVPTGTPHQDTPEEKQFTVVQMPAEFPGGTSAWARYLERNLNQNIPLQEGAPPGRYTVIVAFTVSPTGAISDVQAENDPGYGTKAEAIRVITKGPSWKPAVQNGRNVIYRHKQSITFVVSED